MLPRRYAIALCLVAASAAACAAEPLDETDSAGDAAAGAPLDDSLGTTGVSMNGVSMNGVSMNGVSMNGVSMNGVSTNNGVSMNGVSMNGVSMNGSELEGVAADGSKHQGVGMVGAEFEGSLSDGGTVSLRIDAARASGDTWFYQISYPTSSGRQWLCGLDGAGAPREAVALAGRWDTRQGVPGGGAHIDDPGAFTFGCRGAALAKCVELGYKPWASSGGVSLKNHHQACTRMIRADYCGDGTSYTVNNTPINVYDNLGIQADTESWGVEAEWTPAGARFVAPASGTRVHLTQTTAPPCYEQRVASSVGNLSHFSNGTLLMNEYNP